MCKVVKTNPLLRSSVVLAASLVAFAATAADAPKLTRDFLVYCKADFDGCEDQIEAVHISDIISKKVSYCIPKSAKESRDASIAFHRGIVVWLSDHPPQHGRSTGDSIRSAFGSLYPCQR